MKRYCDYDAIVHYQPGEFASKFADNLREKLEPTDLDALEEEQTRTFQDGKYGIFLHVFPLLYTAYTVSIKEPMIHRGCRERQARAWADSMFQQNLPNPALMQRCGLP